MLSLRSKLASDEVSIFTEISNLSSLNGAINLGQGFPNFDPPKLLLDLVEKHLHANKNQYAPMMGVLELREALAEKIFKLYSRNCDPTSEITITAGATQAIFTAITALVHQGDDVIIFEPAYDSYRPTIELVGGIIRPYIMESPDFKINWNIVKAMVNDRTRMIIINTPHNPTGTILSEDDMKALNYLVKGTSIIILSDEVYEHLVFDGFTNESVIKHPELYQRSIAIFSFGKTYHCTGWKIGYCVAPEYIMKEFRKVHQWNVFSVQSFVQYALAEFIKEEKAYLGLSNFYQDKRDLFLSFIEKSSFIPLKTSGTFFQICDYSKISKSKDREFIKFLIEEMKIAAIPISVFYHGDRDDRLIRFCFAKTDEAVVQAGQILQKI